MIYYSPFLPFLLYSFLLSLFSLDKISEKKLQLIYQNNIVKEYENWTHLLLNIINLTKSNSTDKLTHVDYATPIQKYLEKLSKIENENFDFQRRFVKQSETIKEKQQQLSQLNAKVIILNQDLLDFKKEKLNEEVKQLVGNIENITEELDHLTLVNKKYQGNLDNDSKTILSLIQTVRELEDENAELNTILNLGYFDLFSEEKQITLDSLQNSSINNNYSLYPNNNSVVNNTNNEIENGIIIKKSNLRSNQIRNKKNSNNTFNYDLSSLSCFSGNNTANENDLTLNYFKAN